MRKESLTALHRIQASLELNHRVVGTKFFFTPEEFLASSAKEPPNKIAYCNMVHAAMFGNGVKALAENAGCNGSAGSLGLKAPTPDLESGRDLLRFMQYQDMATCRSMANNITRCRHLAYGLEVRPLAEFTDYDPDVVLLPLNPYNAMRVVQGYAYIYGGSHSFKVFGNQAVCSECTAVPFEKGTLNVSFLCAGTRYRAGWKENEMMAGLPFNQLEGLARGLFETVNIMEPNRKKKVIEDKMDELGLDGLDIRYNFNYYTMNKQKR